MLPLLLLSANPAFAAHDDTTLSYLRVTVIDVNGAEVTIRVESRGWDSTQIPFARLGRQFYLDASPPTYSLNSWTNGGVPPAIEWGDGETIANTYLSFTNTVPIRGGADVLRWASREFTHTYDAPGEYTIRVFGSNRYVPNSPAEYPITYGNTFSTTSPGTQAARGGKGGFKSGLQPIGITNTAEVEVGASILEVPVGSGWGLGLLGLLLAGVGVVVLRR